jgi:lysophospholipid acyltransferase (LPLAT)-like uncharacterized protein
LRVGTDTPVQARAAIQPIEESALARTVWLSQCIARPASLAPWFKVGGQTFRNVEQLFVVSFWHLVLLLATAALRRDRQIYRFFTLNDPGDLIIYIL